MDNENSKLAKEFIEIYVKEEIRKPIRFLEEKFNDFQIEQNLKHKEIKKDIGEINEKLLILRGIIDQNIKSIKDHSNELKSLRNELEKKCSTSDLEPKFSHSEKLNLDLKDLVDKNYLKAEKNHSEHSNYLLRMTENVNLNEINLIDLKNQFKINSDRYETLLKRQESFESDLKLDQIDGASSVERIAKIENHLKQLSEKLTLSEHEIKKSQLTLEQKNEDFKKDSQEKLEKFLMEHSKDIQLNKLRLSESMEKIEDLKEQIILCKKGGKLDKEIDDFVKQISYNAKQIAEIHKMLEVLNGR